MTGSHSGATAHFVWPRHPVPTALAMVLVMAALGWCLGFAWFLNATTRPPPPPPAHVDGIVALTGGAGRVELALRLLARGEADRLLISGIGGNSDMTALGRLAGMDLAPMADDITLGRYATSTRGNAVETAAWAVQHGIRTIIVDTAAYHMPRALAELHGALPDVRLYPLPVEPSSPAGPDHGAADLAPGGPSLRLRAEEYTKYLLVLAGLSPWFPHRDAAPHVGVGG